MKKNAILKIAPILLFIILTLVFVACTQQEVESKIEAPSVSQSGVDTGDTAEKATGSAADSVQSGTGSGVDASPSDTTISVIGDSVPLGAVAQIEQALPGVKMLIRTDRDLAGPGLELLKQESAAGKLGDIVVLALGTSNLKKEDIEKAIEVIGSSRKIVFVNAYRRGASYIEDVNRAIAEVAAAHKDNFIIADWHGYVESHPDIALAEDYCHLTDSSAVEYAKVMKDAVEAAKLKAGA